MKSRHGRSSFVHFRTDSEMVVELDKLVHKLKAEGVKGVSRSSVARSLLQKSLTSDVARAEVREVLSLVWMTVQKTFGRITSEVESSLRIHLEQSYLELSEKNGDTRPRP